MCMYILPKVILQITTSLYMSIIIRTVVSPSFWPSLNRFIRSLGKLWTCNYSGNVTIVMLQYKSYNSVVNHKIQNKVDRLIDLLIDMYLECPIGMDMSKLTKQAQIFMSGGSNSKFSLTCSCAKGLILYVSCIIVTKVPCYSCVVGLDFCKYQNV